jgi:curli production assembly/transport component CsgG
MIKKLFISTILLTLAGCTSYNIAQEVKDSAGPARIQPSSLSLDAVPPLDGDKITIAVYNFLDKTGQRKPSDKLANLSSAVTQGAEVWVIKALQEVGGCTWFDVVERVGMDNLIKERQLIRNTREVYERQEPEGPKPLQPLIFAGLLLEGGVVGYDSNVATGGMGARYLGIGLQDEYRIDTVTVVMRLISVNTGRVLLSVATEKSIASYRSGADIFKFFDLGTQIVESEAGWSVNEPVNFAVRSAIEAGVAELVFEGEAQGLWKFSNDTITAEDHKKFLREDIL